MKRLLDKGISTQRKCISFSLHLNGCFRTFFLSLGTICVLQVNEWLCQCTKLFYEGIDTDIFQNPLWANKGWE